MFILIVSCHNTGSIQKDYNAVMHRSFSVPGKTLHRRKDPLMKREMISQKPHKRSISGLGKHLDLSSGTYPFQRTIPICTFSHLWQNYLAPSTFLKSQGNMQIDVYFTVYSTNYIVYKNEKLEGLFFFLALIVFLIEVYTEYSSLFWQACLLECAREFGTSYIPSKTDINRAL